MGRYQSEIFRILYRMTGVREDAEDLTQETFLRAFRFLDRFRPSERLLPWLVTIAARTGLNFLRSRKEWIKLDEDLERGLFVSAGDVEDSLDRKRDVSRVQQALGKLPSRERIVLVLKYEQDLTASEIAELLKVPRNTVKTWLLRGRERLLRELKS